MAAGSGREGRRPLPQRRHRQRRPLLIAVSEEGAPAGSGGEAGDCCGEWPLVAAWRGGAANGSGHKDVEGSCWYRSGRGVPRQRRRRRRRRPPLVPDGSGCATAGSGGRGSNSLQEELSVGRAPPLAAVAKAATVSGRRWQLWRMGEAPPRAEPAQPAAAANCGRCERSGKRAPVSAAATQAAPAPVRSRRGGGAPDRSGDESGDSSR